ncbi:MAG: hypothetical protein ACRC3J_05220 [Culicoidibacterales bacterium]
MFVTLRHLRENGACFSGYNKVVCALKNVEYVERSRYIAFKYDDKIGLDFIAKYNGVRDTLWALSTINKHYDSHMLSIWIARRIQHLMKPEMVHILNEFEKSKVQGYKANLVLTALNHIFDAKTETEKHVARVLHGVVSETGAFMVFNDLIAVLKDSNESTAYDEQIVEMICKMCINTAPWQQTSQG